MSEAPVTGYQNFTNTDQDQEAVSWKRFFVFVAGKTGGAHHEVVTRFQQHNGQIEVESPVGCDYVVVICPIVSRVGTDINEALNKAPGGKPIILVVMHHTFNQDQVIGDSRRQVNNPNVHLIVDLLFYESQLLDCKLNNDTWADIERLLGVSPVYPSSCWNSTRRIRMVVGLLVLGGLISFLIIFAVKMSAFDGSNRTRHDP